jgi:hypothetical protein
MSESSGPSEGGGSGTVDGRQGAKLIVRFHAAGRRLILISRFLHAFYLDRQRRQAAQNTPCRLFATPQQSNDYRYLRCLPAAESRTLSENFRPRFLPRWTGFERKTFSGLSMIGPSLLSKNPEVGHGAPATTSASRPGPAQGIGFGPE